MDKKTIVVSAVNLNVGGTLTILRDCLSYLSDLAGEDQYRVIALVYRKELAYFPNIEYMETQWPKKRWINRLWYEYVSLKNVSKQIGPVYLWLSLHDTTPNVVAEHRAVYCHNPFPFYKWKWREWWLTPKIVLFAIFSKWIYKKNIKANDYVIVQQQWIKNAFKQLFGLSEKRIIIAIPDRTTKKLLRHEQDVSKKYRFIYAASPNTHKNFECLCEATKRLEKKAVVNFEVYITVAGNENNYARWLSKHWGEVRSLNFVGFVDRQTLFDYYETSQCLVFPSKVETWGLPITEFAATGKPMLLADLPYSYETAAGASQVAFFDPDRPQELADKMLDLINGSETILHRLPEVVLENPVSKNWRELFEILLTDNVMEDDRVVSK